jgi:hypothetical protein
LLQLQSGDVLVAYTDGVTEALNASGEEFGEARLQEALAGGGAPCGGGGARIHPAESAGLVRGRAAAR